MYNPTSTYKMSSQSKRLLSRILNAHDRGAVKKLIVQSELFADTKNRSRSGRDIKTSDTE
jgi:hypothetical protein